jgi:hypothetical protein
MLIASLLVLGATPSCLAGHCGMAFGQDEAVATEHGAMQHMAGMSAAMDCCKDSCPMRDPEACETGMENEKSIDIASTPALPTFELAPAVVASFVTADRPSGASHLGVRHEIDLDALDSSPPVHLLNSQFLI